MGFGDWVRYGAEALVAPGALLLENDQSRDVLLGGAGRSPDPNASRFTDRDMIMQQIQQGLGVGGRQAPQSGGIAIGQAPRIDQSRSDALRMGQLQQIRQLQGIASGQQAGAGELGVNRQVQQALGAQQGAAMMQRGSAASTAGLGASRNMADIGIQGAGQAAQAQLADQGQAQQLLAQALGGTRQQDLSVASQQAQMQQAQIFQQAGLDQATSLANMQARLQMIGMNDQTALAYLAQLTGMNAAELQARMAQEGAAMGQQGLIGPLLQAGGSAAAAGAV